MHLSKHDIPVRRSAPGAIARQLPGFGSVDSGLGAEFFSLAAGTDLAPLLRGLEGDLCQAEHWGYLLAGAVVVTYADGSTENCLEDEVFYWPAGHTVRVDRDAELIMFSPESEHGAVMDHIAGRLAALT